MEIVASLLALNWVNPNLSQLLFSANKKILLALFGIADFNGFHSSYLCEKIHKEPRSYLMVCELRLIFQKKEM